MPPRKPRRGASLSKETLEEAERVLYQKRDSARMNYHLAKEPRDNADVTNHLAELAKRNCEQANALLEVLVFVGMRGLPEKMSLGTDVSNGSTSKGTT